MSDPVRSKVRDAGIVLVGILHSDSVKDASMLIDVVINLLTDAKKILEDYTKTTPSPVSDSIPLSTSTPTTAPAPVVTSLYKINLAGVKQFMLEQLVADKGGTVKQNYLLKAYKNWLTTEPSLRPISVKDFKEIIEGVFGAPLTDKKDGKLYYKGVRLMIEGEDISGNFVDHM